MAGKQKNSDDMINDINITPMVDIMLVLLIIFMVTASFIVTPAIPVKLPSASTGEETDTKTVSIVITKDNKYFVEGKKVSPENLENYLKIKKQTLTKSDNDKKISFQVVISADKKAYHGKVMKVVDMLRRLGITDYAFSIEESE